jgi:hypothetical protein
MKNDDPRTKPKAQLRSKRRPKGSCCSLIRVTKRAHISRKPMLACSAFNERNKVWRSFLRAVLERAGPGRRCFPSGQLRTKREQSAGSNKTSSMR